ncbi:hypothetical protein [Peribacillus sp. NPDC096448]|uniref:hypothetical protein n=1 Tax=Peribacillus sp. NPDC096448 TaxID=3364395 RepID=UPI0037FD475A
MKYKLYPPFLIVPEEEDFSDAWESFCYKLLCLEQSQNNIHRRNPPEQGVDLFDDTDKIAYQCKSIESGKSGDFNVTQAINSLKSALEIKDELGWEKYVLCTNVNVTGSSEKKLKDVYSDVIIKSKNNWEILCETYHDRVERNFNILVEIPSEKVLRSIKENFLEYYSDKLNLQLENERFEIFLFSNQFDRIYKMEVSPDFTIEDLLNIIRKFYKLPESREFISDGIRVSLSHSIVFNKRKQLFSKTLREIGISQGDVITYWTTIIWKDKFELRSDVMHHMTPDMLIGTERKSRAIKRFKKEIIEKFIEFESNLIE